MISKLQMKKFFYSEVLIISLKTSQGTRDTFNPLMCGSFSHTPWSASLASICTQSYFKENAGSSHVWGYLSWYSQSHLGSFSIDGIDCTASSVPHANSSLKTSRKVARWNVVTCARRIGIRMRRFRKYRWRSCTCCYARLKVNFSFGETLLFLLIEVFYIHSDRNIYVHMSKNLASLFVALESVATTESHFIILSFLSSFFLYLFTLCLS